MKRAARILAFVLSAALVLWQAVLLGRTMLADLRFAVREGPLYALENEMPETPNFEISAYRSLRVLERLIPEDARVLLVTPYPNPTIPWEFYFLPRPFWFLQMLDPDWLDELRSQSPELAYVWDAWYERIETRGLRFTEERFSARLDSSDYLLVFFPGIPLPEKRLELVRVHEQSSLYRVRPEGR
ncbi:MAG: hypothetical protein ACE5F1_20130 [Planctomycetota bacterium]